MATRRAGQFCMASFFRPPRFLVRDRAAPRAAPPPKRDVVCYRCAKHSEQNAFAETGSCPHCARQLHFHDKHIDHGHWGTSILTTGSVRIGQHAQVLANLIICSGDIHIDGRVRAMCIAGGRARIGPTAEIEGGIRARSLDLQTGARIKGCLIETESRALGTIDVDQAMRAAPGKGPAAQLELKPHVTPLLSEPAIAARIIPGPNGPRAALRTPDRPKDNRAVS